MMWIRGKTKAQSILEYVTLIGIISASLLAMQLYFRRGIQATVKIAADQIGSQKEGAADYDYKNEWKIKGFSEVTSSSSGISSVEQKSKGEVSYGKDDTTTQTGVLSWGWWQEKK